MSFLQLAASLLFVPANRGDRLERALGSGADALILDLEDSIAPAEKAATRAGLPGLIDTVRMRGLPSIVRTNAGPELVADLAAMPAAWPDAIMVPKIETPAQIREVFSNLAAQDAPTGLTVIALIETPLGVVNCASICADCPSLGGVAFGGEDYATAMGVSSGPNELGFAARTVALAARAHDLPAFGIIGSIAEIQDQEAFSSYCRSAREAGFTGAMTIHPAQVTTANATFSASTEELTWARGVIEDSEGFDGAAIKGRDGRMIDAPILTRARSLLARESRRP